MRPEEYIINKELNIDIDKIEIPNFENQEIEIINEYVEFTRHFQELYQLFHVFKVNLNHLLRHYTLMSNDRIIKNDDFDEGESNDIAINALTINYISSARTFVESIETFIKARMGEEKLQEFKDGYLSKKYDEIFSYRLLYHLRNYAQHGHLPVFVDGNNRCCFHLDYILNTPHYDYNKKLKDEMELIRKKIMEEYEDNPRLMFTRTIAELQIVIQEIYISFIDFVYKELSLLQSEINQLIERKPNIIYKSNDVFKGWIFYEIRDNSLQCFDPKENPKEMTEIIRKEVITNLKADREKFKDVFKGINEN